jgi:hypothetical protein
LFFPERLQSFCRAETFIGPALLKQLFCIVKIESEALRLTIGASRSSSVRSFFPLDSQPPQIFEDVVARGVGRSLHVGIFNAEDESSTMVFCKDMIEEGSASVSDMEKTRWGRSESDPDT